MVKLQPFYLLRHEDESGVSGEGIVAIGVILPSGQAVMEWLTFMSSVAIYKNIEQLREIHGHGDKTEVIMGDPPTPEEEKPKKKVRRKKT